MVFNRLILIQWLSIPHQHRQSRKISFGVTFLGLRIKRKINEGGKLLKTQFNIDEDWFVLCSSTQNGEVGMEVFRGGKENISWLLLMRLPACIKECLRGHWRCAGGGSVVVCFWLVTQQETLAIFLLTLKIRFIIKSTYQLFDIPNVRLWSRGCSGLATHEWVAEMKSKYGEDSDVYRVRVEGEFPRKTVIRLIPLELCWKCSDAERERYGEEEVIGFDPALWWRQFTFCSPKRKCCEGSWGHWSSRHNGTIKKRRYLLKYPNAVLNIDIIGLWRRCVWPPKEQPEVAERVVGSIPASSPNRYWIVYKLALRHGTTQRHGCDAILERHEGFYELPAWNINSRHRGKIQLESKERHENMRCQITKRCRCLVLTLSRPTEGAVPIIYLGNVVFPHRTVCNKKMSTWYNCWYSK